MANYVAPTNAKLVMDQYVDKQVLLTFDWPAKWGNYTARYDVWWFYTTEAGNQFSAGLESWDPVWGDPAAKKKTWSYPDGTARVEARVQAFPTDEYKFLPKITTATIDVKANAFPTVPSTPTVTILPNGDIRASLENINSDTKQIEFQFYQSDTNLAYKTVKVSVSSTNAASYDVLPVPGHIYKVRARAFKNSKLSSQWSEWTSEVYARPVHPELTAVQAYLGTGQQNPTSFKATWKKFGGPDSYYNVADHFTVEYTNDIQNFNNEITASIQSQDTENNLATSLTVTGLEGGLTYYVRVKAVNDSGSSKASNIRSVVIGSKPAVPTTWSGTTTMKVGDSNHLYWVHNPTDGSSQTNAKVAFSFKNGIYTETITLPNTTDPAHIDDTSDLLINTANGTYTWFGTAYPFSTLTAAVFTLGGDLKWAVQTSGITILPNNTPEYSDLSIQRQIDIFAAPTYSFTCSSLEAYSGIPSYSLPSYPINLTAETVITDSQVPNSYHVLIVANESYRTIGVDGKYNYISEGQVVFEGFYDDIGSSLVGNSSTTYTKNVSLSAGDVDLESGISYSMTMSVTLDSAIVEEDTIDFIVLWEDSTFSVIADIFIDEDQLAASIRPYCMSYETEEGQYTAIDTTLEEYAGRKPAWVGWYEYANSEYVLSEDLEINPSKTYYEPTMTEELIDDAILSVYRRNYDNSFTLIADNIPNNSITSIVDPHPQLNSASYRIVAMSQSNGGMSWNDYYGIEVNEKSLVFQWDESWNNYYEEDEATTIEYPYAGSMLKLPYNIDITSNNSPDVTTIEYIGRQHPVSYYGTQLGETASWSVDIPKTDTESLSKIRELMTYMGDVYVREPSGIGFWAHVKVSYNINHCELVIPISFEITRVEGGI